MIESQTKFLKMSFFEEELIKEIRIRPFIKLCLFMIKFLGRSSFAKRKVNENRKCKKKLN